jgi:uncharacterized protein YlxW (UPF0749 family)
MSNVSLRVSNLFYRDSAQASQRGLKKLQRKVEAGKARIEFLEKFIDDRQLSTDLAAIQQRIKEERYAAWRAWTIENS